MILQNNRLHVTIDKPGEKYKGSRFDWTGQVSQVLLDNAISFCGSETDNPDNSLSGSGLCNEFGILTPVGYSDCPEGGLFPKIGVGLLVKEDQRPYNFFKQYQLRPALHEVFQASDDQLTIESRITSERGYSCVLLKKFTLSDTTFSIRYSLENTGSQVIETEEYGHNFVCINNQPVNSDYQLTAFSFNLDNLKEAVNPDKCVKLLRHSISWETEPKGDFFFTDLNDQASPTQSWTIKNKAVGAAICETVDLPVKTFNLWGKHNVISPEMFVAINVAPHQKMSWTRMYEFITL